MPETTPEPLHASRQDAVKWVQANTDNSVFRAGNPLAGTEKVIRVDARGAILILEPTVSGDAWYWLLAREI